MTYRIAHLADLHCDERADLADWRRVLWVFIEQARAHQVDLILIPGDLFERKSSPAERNAMADFLLEAAERVAPIYIVPGNHDAEGDLEIYGRLDADSFVEILERPTVEPGSASRYVIGQTTVATPGERVAVLALPWFTKRHLAALCPAEAGTAETTEATIQAAQGLLAMIRAEADHCRQQGMIPLLVAHVQVAGSEVSTGQTLIGQTVELAPGALRDAGCEYVALGHIHKRQAWYDGRVAYSGSPRRCNFGEPEAKGWNLVTIEGGRFAGCEFVELPARRVVLLEADWSEGVGTLRATSGEVEGALVRFRCRVRPRDLHLVDSEQIERDLRRLGAATAKCEIVVEHETRARCAGVAEAESVWEKLLAYWEAKGVELEPAQATRLEAKVAELEEAEPCA